MATSVGNVIRASIIQKLTEALKPSYLDVINESFMHNVPKDAETHFKVVVVSKEFDGKPLIQRHRFINDLLKQELLAGVHALSIQAKTPEQWAQNCNVSLSPPCLGGSKK
ncbi:bolA-like protein 1 isoform X2 [Hydra vulgaris]|uniref:BolA-like protein 1 isoform X2 n=1 Tax=Hydra vulgaris TaxID=6087 RepID=A0ABM4BTY8_HYDVU